METNKRKLLLVDDDPSLLETTSDFLVFEGYDVLCATSGEDALVKIRDFQPDLIILDMSMPGMGGTGFLDRITNPDDGSTLFPVLVLTARAAMAEFFANKNVAGFVAKPCDPNDLLMEVNRIIFEHSNSINTPTAPKTLRRLVLAEPNASLRSTLEDQLRKSGFEVVAVNSGAEALESCITYSPDALVIRLESGDMSADEVVSMLRRLPHSRDLPAVVYGLDLPEVQQEHLARLLVPQQRLVNDLAVDRIVERALAVTGA